MKARAWMLVVALAGIAGCATICSVIPLSVVCPSSTPTVAPTIAPTVAPPTPTPAVVCCADCNGDGNVTIDERIKQSDILQGKQPLSACPAADCNHDGVVDVADLTALSNNPPSCSQ